MRPIATTAAAFALRAPAAIRARALTPLPFGAVGHLANEVPEGLADGITALRSVPNLSALHGNLFSIGGDPLESWYLPQFTMADDPDSSFSFAASQTVEVDEHTGRPFNTCRFSMTLRKVIPDDAAAFSASFGTLPRPVPGPALLEVPLNNLEAAILVQTVNAGVVQWTPFKAQLTALADNHFLLTADAILGVGVIALYQNLTLGATARCSVSASYRAYTLDIPPGVPLRLKDMFPFYRAFDAVPFNNTLEIGAKYQGDAYRLAYTIATTGAPRVIINADDLDGFNVRQSEYVELKVLGDLAARYPSIAKAYLGVISKTLMVIPARYVLLRDTAGCRGRCTALVDSSPGLAAGCKFQLAFTLAPDVSGIDLLLLMDELKARVETQLHNLTLKLPSQFSLDADATLASVFQSDVQYTEDGSDAHNVALSVAIREQAGGTPAVANANLFLAQLRSLRAPFLTGSIAIKLDDVFPFPIKAPVVLTFTNTQTDGGAGLALSLDAEKQQAVLHNATPYPFNVARIALLSPHGTTVTDVGKIVPAAADLALALPAALQAGADDVTLLADCEYAFDAGLSKADLFKLLPLEAVDVQDTQYLFSVNASAVDFAGRGIAQVDAVIALRAAPAQPVATLHLTADRKVDSARVVLPFNQALIELLAVIVVDVRFADAARAPQQVSLDNDFGQHPLFQITDQDLPPALP